MRHVLRWLGKRRECDKDVVLRWYHAAELTLRDGRNLEKICESALGQSPQRVLPLGLQANGCQSFCLDFAEYRLKCFETLSPERSEMVVRATRALTQSGVPIPRVETTFGANVFAEWIEGDTIDRQDIDSVWLPMAEYQGRIHQAQVTPFVARETEFVHLRWLLDRLRVHSSRHFNAVAVERLCSWIEQLVPQDLRVHVTMPDFLPSNIVRRPNGELVCVDNEFLAIGTGAEFDLLNTLRHAFVARQQVVDRYLEVYHHMSGASAFFRHLPFWEIVYIAKMAGKFLAVGDMQQGRDLFHQLQQRVEAYGDKKVA